MEPRDVPADVYDAIETAFGRWPHVVTEDDHKAGAYLTVPVGDWVFINCRFVTPDGYLMFRGEPMRRMVQ